MLPEYNCVKCFHEKHGYAVGRPITLNGEIWRRSLILEELAELNHAWTRQKPLEVLDAIGDLLYVVLGTQVEFDLYEEHRPLSIVGYGAGWDEGYPLMTLNITIAEQLSMPFCHDNLAMIVTRIQQFAEAMHIQLGEVFNRVHSSNMTKAVGGLKPKGEGFVPPDFSDLNWEP